MMVRLAILAALISCPAAAADPGTGHVTGIGGVFVKSKDPKALAAWYRDMLGVKMEDWGGAALRTDAPHHPDKVAWMAFPSSTKYLAPSTRDFMLDFEVDDLDAILARLSAKGVNVLKRDDSDPTARFAWLLDPDGTKIELRQAK
jgi:catechol 2,3-dioxygenase-like lactoylglutathione lyase family enzyme